MLFSGAITDFALATDAQRIFQGVMRLALVQANLGTTLHVGVQQAINDKERALDATNFAQGQSEIMLTRIGREFAQKLAGRYDARRHSSSAAQDIRPIGNNLGLLDLAAEEGRSSFGMAAGSKT